MLISTFLPKANQRTRSHSNQAFSLGCHQLAPQWMQLLEKDVHRRNVSKSVMHSAAFQFCLSSCCPQVQFTA
ncbi:hypothetical protein D918_03561 [Trichuris suis]|nr:hypothetical protein D918_03561 [Trichuris suis]